ncbi:XRE family transcriptional regulator [Candidatus Acidianus copahuensis]|uniref:XRE family transcriptional regulator n=1 Tax=Candidatus Acidianus copahuensis TaxID=1160895 RepID=A0A031LLH4_9CREN|nr:XRE family transcriptional regulator [Candidatus Acidianus copahuensis]
MLIDREEIKRLRRLAGITQAQLAKRIGVSQSFIAKIESGRIDPKLSLVRRILDELTREVQIRSEAKDIMHSPVITSTINERIDSIIYKMEKNNISQIPVISSSQKAIGIIYDYIILRKLSLNSKSSLLAKDVIAPLPPLVTKQSPINDIMKLLSRHSVILVINNNLRIDGIITRSDLLGYLVNKNKGSPDRGLRDI